MKSRVSGLELNENLMQMVIRPDVLICLLSQWSLHAVVEITLLITQLDSAITQMCVQRCC